METMLTVMGKGLSPLQRTILEIALENRRSGNTGFGRREAYHSEVFERYFGWQPRNDCKRRYQRFTVSAIGEQRYRTAHASVSRAFKRLERRGLIECCFDAYCLTPEGVASAEQAARKS
jgi:hypothetical protein